MFGQQLDIHFMNNVLQEMHISFICKTGAKLQTHGLFVCGALASKRSYFPREIIFL